MKLKGLVAIIVGLVLVFSVGTSVSAQEFNVGKVQLQTVVQQHPEAMEYQSKIQEEIMSLQQEYQEKTSNLNPEEDSEELQQLQQEFQEEAASYQENFQTDLMEILDPEFEEFMNEKGYDMIVMEGGIVASNNDVNAVNVTDEFIEFSGGETEEEMDSDVENNNN